MTYKIASIVFEISFTEMLYLANRIFVPNRDHIIPQFFALQS